jgi:hypothetical protein
MIGAERNRFSDRNRQARNVSVLTAIFKALLSAKEARQKGIQEIGENNRCST